MTRRLLLWGPVVAYMAAIFYVSSLSEAPLPPGFSDKPSHSLAYLGLAITIARALAGGLPARVGMRTALVAVLVTIAYGVTGPRLGLLVLSIGAVLGTEIMNTAIERTCDLVAELHGLGHDRRIRDIKDLAAAAVLVVALGAAIIGIIVFSPYLT